MLKPFVCRNGNGSLLQQQQQQEEDYVQWSSSSSSPRKLSFKKTNKNKNPYSNRGIDKFQTVLADLEDRKQKIYQQFDGSQEQIEIVRFVYSDSKGWVPIIVKLKDNQNKEKTANDLHHHQKLLNNNIKKNLSSHDLESAISVKPSSQITQEPKQVLDGLMKKKKKRVNLVNSLGNYSCKYWFFMAINLILLCLIIYGRSLAIICTSIFWYLMDFIKGDMNNLRSSSMNIKKKISKKEFIRSKSEQKINNINHEFS